MSKTIDDFRDFFKPAKTKEPFSLKRACEEAMSLADASVKSRDIHLELYVKEDKQVVGYASEFAQVILNLILNAKDVLIERDIKNPTILIKIDVKNEKVFVSVSDNGGGVEESIIEKVFEPYFSTKKTAGTGLGLYMSKMIIEEKMGGKLFVENSEEGAMFCIKI
jgi:signal transduction histidine kinase